jgi:hypothetical protein
MLDFSLAHVFAPFAHFVVPFFSSIIIRGELQTEITGLYSGLSLTLVTPDLTWRGGRSILLNLNC